MSNKLSLTAAAVLLAVAGCAAPQQTPSQLNTRLISAKQISDVAAHDQQLTIIAGDAANARNSEACLDAVSAIIDDGARDTSAHACADTFNNFGDRKVAAMLVDKITNPTLRDSMRADYARMAPSN